MAGMLKKLGFDKVFDFSFVRRSDDCGRDDGIFEPL